MNNKWVSEKTSNYFKMHFNAAMEYARISKEELAKQNGSSAIVLWNDIFSPRSKILRSKLIKWTEVLKISIYNSIDNGLPYYNALCSVYQFNTCIELLNGDENDKIIPYFCQTGGCKTDE